MSRHCNSLAPSLLQTHIDVTLIIAYDMTNQFTHAFYKGGYIFDVKYDDFETIVACMKQFYLLKNSTPRICDKIFDKVASQIPKKYSEREKLIFITCFHYHVDQY